MSLIQYKKTPTFFNYHIKTIFQYKTVKLSTKLVCCYKNELNFFFLIILADHSGLLKTCVIQNATSSLTT